MMCGGVREQMYAIAIGHPAEISSYVIFLFLTCLCLWLSFRLSISKNKVCVIIFCLVTFLFYGL